MCFQCIFQNTFPSINAAKSKTHSTTLKEKNIFPVHYVTQSKTGPLWLVRAPAARLMNNSTWSAGQTDGSEWHLGCLQDSLSASKHSPRPYVPGGADGKPLDFKQTVSRWGTQANREDKQWVRCCVLRDKHEECELQMQKEKCIALINTGK